MQHGLIIVPARAGSVGVPQKNTRAIGGVPMMAWAIEKLHYVSLACRECLDLDLHVIFASDDEEVLARVMTHQRFNHVTASLPWLMGLHRPREAAGADQTIAELVAWVIGEIQGDLDEIAAEGYDATVDFIGVHQPSSPTFTAQSMYDMIEKFVQHPEYDSATTVVADHSFRWSSRDGQDPPNRVNRQFRPLEDRRWVETGAMHLVRGFPRDDMAGSPMIGAVHDLFEIDPEEAIDIDTPLHFAAAATVLDRPTINILAHGSHEIGSGHLRRAAAIARGLQPYANVQMFCWDTPMDMRRLFDGDVPNVLGSDLHLLWADADLVVSDCLNLDLRQHTAANPGRTLRLESTLIDSNTTLINGLYTFPGGNCGSRWMDIRDEFRYLPPYVVNTSIENILVSFGGTDPAGLTAPVANLLLKLDFLDGVHITVIAPPNGTVGDLQTSSSQIEVLENPSMSWEMSSHDLLITGRGRTQFEAAAVGIPTISIPVNTRERYEHGIPEGVVSIIPSHEPGEGYDPWPTTAEVLPQEVFMALDTKVRQARSRMMQDDVDGHGMDRIVERILIEAREQRRRRPAFIAGLAEETGS